VKRLLLLAFVVAAAIASSLLLTSETAPAGLAAAPPPRAVADVRVASLPELPLGASALVTREPESALADSPVASAAVSGASSGVRAAAVHGRLLDQDGIGVPGAVVSLYRGPIRLDVSTDAGGAFEFPGLRPGSYRAVVQPHSLPQGLLPPAQQHLAREPEQNPDGSLGTAFRLSAGAEREIVLRAFAAGSVSGRVVDEAGALLSGALVSVRSAAGTTDNARTDVAGRFTLPALAPGRHALSVQLDPARPDADTSAPLPAVFDLGPHEDRALRDLVAGSSGQVLRGSVVDLAGRPVPGMTLECREERLDGPGGCWLRVTDAEGRYALGRVPPGVLLLTLLDDRRVTRLRAPVEPVRVEARGESEVIEVAPIRVEASRPFRVVGRVRVDADWAQDLGRWTAHARLRELDALPGAAAELHLGPTGDFEWSCATPHPEVELLVVLRGDAGREVERRERVRPVADEARELVVDFP